MNIHNYLQVILDIERKLAEYFIKIAEYHKSEQEIYYGCQEMAAVSNEHIREIKRIPGGIEGKSSEQHESMISDIEIGIDLEADLRFLWLLTKESGLYYSLLHHASLSNGDRTVASISNSNEQESAKQSSWLFSRIMYTAETISARS